MVKAYDAALKMEYCPPLSLVDRVKRETVQGTEVLARAKQALPLSMADRTKEDVPWPLQLLVDRVKGEEVYGLEVFVKTKQTLPLSLLDRV